MCLRFTQESLIFQEQATLSKVWYIYELSFHRIVKPAVSSTEPFLLNLSSDFSFL